jgi:hypothetical protein
VGEIGKLTIEILCEPVERDAIPAGATTVAPDALPGCVQRFDAGDF